MSNTAHGDTNRPKGVTHTMKATPKVTEAVEAYLNALSVKEQAEQAHDEARELMLTVLAENGLNEVAVGEVTVKVSPAERRAWDTDRLRDLVSPALYKTVTKPTVDTHAWDRAVKEGKVTAKVVKAVVTVTQSVRVLVRPTKGAEKPIATKSTKSA